MSRVKNPRVLLAAGVVLVVVALGVVVAVLGGESSSEEDQTARHVVRTELTLEKFDRPDTGVPELLVSSPSRQLNRVDLNGGSRLAWLRCFDRGGVVVIRRPVDWPLLEEPGYAPHLHQPAGPDVLNAIRRCRLTGRGIDFEGAVAGRVPAAK